MRRWWRRPDRAEPAATWQGAALALGAALAAGLLIGIERGWALRKSRAGSRIAGVRTFTLLGLIGGLGGLLSAAGYVVVGAGLTLTSATVLVIAHSRPLRGNRDATSAIAALTTLAIGFLAGSGSIGPSLAAAAAVVLVLALRENLHTGSSSGCRGTISRRWRGTRRSRWRCFRSCPTGPWGPTRPGIRPKLWWVVVLVTGFSFVGYAAGRVFGANRGTLLTALIGGAYSSTAVTQSLAQRLGSDNRAGAEAAGIALASAVMYVRVIVLVAVLARGLLLPFLAVIGPALAVAWLCAFLLYRRAPRSEGPAAPGNPITLLPALGFLVFVAAAAVAARWAESRFGESGIAILLFVMGVMDVDASIVTAGGLAPEAIAPVLAAAAIGGTIVANMAVKVAVTLAYARRNGSAAAVSLAASAVTLAATVAWRWQLR